MRRRMESLPSHQSKCLATFSWRVTEVFEFFTVYAKLAGMAVMASKDLTTGEKATSDARDYYQFRSPMSNQLS